MENTSYFDLVCPKRPASETGDAVSPLSTPQTAPAAMVSTSSRPQLIDRPSSKSDYGSTRVHPRVDTIHEEHNGLMANMHAPVDVLSNRQDFRSTERKNRISSHSSPRHSSDQSPVWQPSSTLSTVESVRSSDRSETDNVQRPIHNSRFWARSSSGSSFFERPSGRNDIPSSSHGPYSQSRSQSPTVIQPLRPPTPAYRQQPSSPPEPRVRIETSFTELRKKAQAADTNHCMTEVVQKSASSRSRRSSINPFHIFSIPFTALRNYNRQKGMSTASQRPPLHSHTPVSNDKFATNWKKQHVAVPLPRVSSLLQELDSHRVRTRTWSDQSLSSDAAMAVPQGRDDIHKQPMMTMLERAKSMEMIHGQNSTSSSLVILKMGPQPPNTPEEQATYRIKRRPSAEPEEFLKTDISIRGNTSYLPSEAKRIHTPPLPKEGPDGRHRGFFFDYNATREDKELRSPSRMGSQLSASTPFSHPLPVGHKKSSHQVRSNCRVKSGDWYGAQLARIDSPSESRDDSDQGSTIGESSPNRSRSSTLDADHRGVTKLDYNIPEHLPTSPLCPRHPRYWRVMRKKGSQFRGCWMHGFGIYRPEEIARYGIK